MLKSIAASISTRTKIFIGATISVLLLGLFFIVLFFTIMGNSSARRARVPAIVNPNVIFTMPSEQDLHEGTWLQWPHDYGWDRRHVRRYESAWVEMTKTLHPAERVHIVVYNDLEQQRVDRLLRQHAVDMDQIDFYTWPTDDVWIRDNGPIFVFDENDELVVENWKFNGWGKKSDYKLCDQIPIDVARELGLPRIDVPMVNEGGSVEIDANGMFMGKKSSILNRNRNPGWTQADAEAYFAKYLGVKKFIWLEGKRGADITDDHIDGTARFGPNNTIVTFPRDQFLNPAEYDVLKASTNMDGKPFELVELPATTKKIRAVGDYGIYINYYIGNEVIILAKFNDPSDQVAMEVLQDLYPTRRMVPIDFTEVYKDGGLMHCVTQQQPSVEWFRRNRR